MSQIPKYICRISSDNVNLINNLLVKENFHEQDSPLTLLKSNLDSQIEVNLSQSYDHPSIICCCSTIPVTLPQLLSFLDSNSTNSIQLILFVGTNESIDWNPLINMISAFNLSLNIVNDEYQFSSKLTDIIINLAKQNFARKSLSTVNNHEPTGVEKQVKFHS